MSAEPSIVRLEHWGPGDLGLLRGLHADPAMMEHLGGPESEEKLADRLARYRAPGSGMFRVVELEGGESAGSIGLWTRTWRGEDIWETGWAVLPRFQRRGIALAAARAVIEKAASRPERHALHAFPAVENGPSNAICRRLGFVLVEESELEYPPGHRMRCNVWRLELG